MRTRRKLPELLNEVHKKEKKLKHRICHLITANEVFLLQLLKFR